MSIFPHSVVFIFHISEIEVFSSIRIANVQPKNIEKLHQVRDENDTTDTAKYWNITKEPSFINPGVDKRCIDFIETAIKISTELKQKLILEAELWSAEKMKYAILFRLYNKNTDNIGYSQLNKQNGNVTNFFYLSRYFIPLCFIVMFFQVLSNVRRGFVPMKISISLLFYVWDKYWKQRTV